MTSRRDCTRDVYLFGHIIMNGTQYQRLYVILHQHSEICQVYSHYWDSYIFETIWTNQTRVTITVTDYGKWEFSLVSSVTSLLNFILQSIWFSCGWSYCAPQRESNFQTL